MDGPGAVIPGSHSQALDQPPSYSETTQNTEQETIQPEQPPDEEVSSQQILIPQLVVAPTCADSVQDTQHTSDNALQQSTQSGQHLGHGVLSQQMWIFQPITTDNPAQVSTGVTMHLPYSVKYYATLKNINFCK